MIQFTRGLSRCPAGAQVIQADGRHYRSVDGICFHIHDGTRAHTRSGTLATLALGAAGLYAWRRHRQKQAEKAQQDTDKNS